MDPLPSEYVSTFEGQKRAAQLLPLVYEDLRALAAQKLAQEKPGHTLQPTALVHEAYLRVMGSEPEHGWDGRNHFFAAAAEAMRRILVEAARRKRLIPRIDLQLQELPSPSCDDRMLDLQDALESLESVEPLAGKIAVLRLFAGLSVEEAADVLHLARATAYREWTFARAWLSEKLLSQSVRM
ncbi:MAG: ECF-type sigma factor [Gemmataceae bacterium]